MRHVPIASSLRGAVRRTASNPIAAMLAARWHSVADSGRAGSRRGPVRAGGYGCERVCTELVHARHVHGSPTRGMGMTINVGDRVRAKRELPGRLFPPQNRVRKGTPGTVYRVSVWSGRYSVGFDTDTRRQNLTDDDIEPKTRRW
jgi:hypothetical protein